MKKIIGITGGFGVGKSTVCKFFEKLEAEWIEADKIVHRLYEPKGIGYKKIKEYFGDSYVNKRGVNRDKLRKIVLGNARKLEMLNKLIHPLVANELGKIIRRGKKGIFVIESIYFGKNDFGKLVNKIILVRRNARLVEKSRKGEWRTEDIEKFIKLPLVFPKADFTMENNGSLAALNKRVAEVYADLVDL